MRRLIGLTAGLLLASGAAAAQTTDVKFALDWAVQGNHAIWTLAQDKGHFAREGLNVTIDRGFGSGDTVTKVASGAYDMGFADINALVPFVAANPGARTRAVFLVFDQSLSGVIAHKGGPIARPKDIEGRMLASPEAEASRLLFPAFARANGIDVSRVAWQSVTPQLREALLAQKRVDGITGFISTAIFNLKAAGIAPDTLNVMRFNDHGVDLVGSAVIVSDAYAQRNPRAVAAMVRATIAGLRDLLADPKEGMAGLKRRDGLINEALELERWELVRDLVVVTPNVRQNGFSHLPPDRLERTIGVVATAYNVADKVKGADVYTEAFLPPPAERALRR
jgi:NitT/TauT family transport system substrate-binding protein